MHTEGIWKENQFNHHWGLQSIARPQSAKDQVDALLAHKNIGYNSVLLLVRYSFSGRQGHTAVAPSTNMD